MYGNFLVVRKGLGYGWRLYFLLCVAWRMGGVFFSIIGGERCSTTLGVIWYISVMDSWRYHIFIHGGLGGEDWVGWVKSYLHKKLGREEGTLAGFEKQLPAVLLGSFSCIQSIWKEYPITTPWIVVVVRKYSKA